MIRPFFHSSLKRITHNVVPAFAATTIGSYAAASFFGGKRP